MTAFFHHVLDDFLTPAFLEEVRSKFHFSETHRMELRTVAKRMLPLMRKEAFWERKKYRMSGQCPAAKSDCVSEIVVMSLGRGIDCLQETYEKRELLLSSYMVETLAGEILMRGYEAYRQYVENETGLYVAGYHFPGSEENFPLAMLPDLLKECSLQITCNDAFCMIPNKSVAFIAELTYHENVHCKSICFGCNNKDCPNRMRDENRQ